ncbi:hypothetical protein BDZ89DRAFT_364741 [Hymenopellis radicata]|nr:hypothetical protein BDZ89DRAFT_364741 [Hymenopellis radicata]
MYAGRSSGDPGPRWQKFGFGRRACPGQEPAEASIWITLASILATFDIKRIAGGDPTGGCIVQGMIWQVHVTRTFVPGLILDQPFKCNIKPSQRLPRCLLGTLTVGGDLRF